ncbi:hypothetical protein ES705_30946 [subsurface metagenome]
MNMLKNSKTKDPIRISGKNLSELAEKNKWKGTGTENDPIIIDSIEESEEKLIECPRCDYTCRMSWKKCPICETKI